jgi:hypothetical protein
MRLMKLLTFAVAALGFLATPASIAGDQGSTPESASQSSPRAVNDVLAAQPFTLQQGYRNNWTKERSTVSSGVVVVLEVDPELAARRDAAEPILYAGNTPVQRLNNPLTSGRVIGIVPGVVDLTGVPIWFGAPGLPERVTAESARAERTRAEASGIHAFAADKVRAAMRPAVTAPDLAALLRDHVAPLVLQYSPEEKELAESWRLPVATAPPKQQPR